MSKTEVSEFPQGNVIVEDDRTSMHPKALKRAFLDHLAYMRGRSLEGATPHDRLHALAYLVRDRLMARWAKTRRDLASEGAKRVYYLSAEFLLGRLMASNLLAVDLYDPMKEVLAKTP